MDASTSQKQKKQLMGTPDSRITDYELEYFLFHGGLPGKREISNKIWAEIIKKFLYLADPHFKYIDGLKTVEQIIVDGEWLNCHGAIEITDAGMTFSPADQINKKTRGFFIFTLQHSPFGKGGGLPVNYTNLILSEKGKWIKWEAIRLGHSCSSNLSLLSDEGFCSILDETKHSGYSVMDKTYLILYHSRGRKEERLASIRKLEETAQQICNRAK